jgi:type II secretory pathway predicted ATPase ExeA
MDFLEYYNLREHPFSNVVDNKFYYNSAQHSSALIKLKHAIDNRRGLSIVIGDIGSGKTTLARRLLEELDEDRYEAALLVIIHSSVSSDWLLKKLALQLGVDEPSDEKLDLLGQLYRRLVEIHEAGKTSIVLMDEVQMLNSREIMEEFRGLLNMEIPEGKLINLIFFGLNELETVMSLDEPLRQRVAMRIKINAFAESDTHDYVVHRLRVAGSDSSMFSEGAIREIYRFSSGLPRLINTICDNALLEGFLMKLSTIDADVIRTVAVDLGLCEMSADERCVAGPKRDAESTLPEPPGGEEAGSEEAVEDPLAFLNEGALEGDEGEDPLAFLGEDSESDDDDLLADMK